MHWIFCSCVTVLIDFLHTYMIVYVFRMDLLARTSATRTHTAAAIAPHPMVHVASAPDEYIDALTKSYKYHNRK